MDAIKSILFVENDPVALQMYSARLEREGFHITAAQDGLEALKQISQLTPDLLVLDIVLPKLGGEDVLKFLRADPRLKSLPVILFSNSPLANLSSEVATAGPTQFLLKSDCTFPMLLRTIQDLLALREIGAHPDPAPAPQPGNSLRPAEVPQPTGSIEPEGGEDASGSGGVCDRFLAEALADMPKIREFCFAYIKAPASTASLQYLPQLYQHIHALSIHGAQAGCARVSLLTKTFDALLAEIRVKPSWVTPSVLQTIAQAVDCLSLLLKSSPADLTKPMPQVKVLAVDDDAVCNHVMVTTLKRAGFDARSVDDPMAALQLLESNPFDLILLDISMPGMTGFELCEKLRRFPHCKGVPVIFITGHNNFDNRKQSVLSGGHDFITKPVSPSELALKATIHLLKPSGHHGAAASSDTETRTAGNPSTTPLSPAVTTLPATVAPPSNAAEPVITAAAEAVVTAAAESLTNTATEATAEAIGAAEPVAAAEPPTEISPVATPAPSAAVPDNPEVEQVVSAAELMPATESVTTAAAAIDAPEAAIPANGEAPAPGPENPDSTAPAPAEQASGPDLECALASISAPQQQDSSANAVADTIPAHEQDADSFPQPELVSVPAASGVTGSETTALAIAEAGAIADAQADSIASPQSSLANATVPEANAAAMPGTGTVTLSPETAPADSEAPVETAPEVCAGLTEPSVIAESSTSTATSDQPGDEGQPESESASTPGPELAAGTPEIATAACGETGDVTATEAGGAAAVDPESMPVPGERIAERPPDPDARFEEIVRIVTRMMFGEENLSPQHMRLVSIALEHYKLRDLL